MKTRPLKKKNYTNVFNFHSLDNISFVQINTTLI